MPVDTGAPAVHSWAQIRQNKSQWVQQHLYKHTDSCSRAAAYWDDCGGYIMSSNDSVQWSIQPGADTRNCALYIASVV
jgi:hypothetical protein